MADGHDRMIQEHSGRGEPHHCSDFLSHFGFVAMHLAVGTEGFCFHKRAQIAAESGIGIQCCTFGAERFGAMLFAAVERYHERYNFFLPFSFCFGIHVVELLCILV